MSDGTGHEAIDFADVLNAELKLISTRRKWVREKVARGSGPSIEPIEGGAAGGGPPPPPPTKSAPEDQKKARLETLDRHVAGVALSGGGIRSATFAMGVLQGLADLKLLSRFDYLSTVSGGGYIGGWLAAWMKREGDPLAVEKQLSPSRVEEAKVDRDVIGQKIVDEEPEAIHHLRAYSNYPTPRPGLLSTDTWTVLTIYARNALINLLLLLPTTMIIVLLGRLVVGFYGQTGAGVLPVFPDVVVPIRSLASSSGGSSGRSGSRSSSSGSRFTEHGAPGPFAMRSRRPPGP